MPPVSIIVPVYKVEQYIRQCVDSLLSQSFRDVEVILVDDGSPDGCPAICDEYAQVDSRVRVLHKPNGGLSDARNAGLGTATGHWVTFVDSDDFWVHNGVLEQLMDIARDNPDVDFIGFNCGYYYTNTQRFEPWGAYPEDLLTVQDGNQALCHLVQTGTFPMSACLKVIRRDFLVGNNITFEKGLLSEDVPWFINILEAADKCLFTNIYAYAYRQNVSGSITTSNGERSYQSVLKIVQRELDIIEERRFSIEAKEALLSFLAYEWLILLTYPIGNKRRKRELYQYRHLIRHTTNPKVKKANMVYRIAGFWGTVFAMCLWQWVRRKRMQVK